MGPKVKKHPKQPKLGYFRGILDNTALLPMHRTRFRIGIFILKHPQAEIINYTAALVVVWILYGSRKQQKIAKNCQNEPFSRFFGQYSLVTYA